MFILAPDLMTWPRFWSYAFGQQYSIYSPVLQINNYWHREWWLKFVRALCPSCGSSFIPETPGTSSLHHASHSGAHALTADAGKLDSVHWVENYDTWPVGLETRLIHAPFSHPCLLHLSSGALALWWGGWQLQRVEETCSCFLLTLKNPGPQSGETRYGSHPL